MANSKYEYVKSFEIDDEIIFPNLIVLRIQARDFHIFSQVHEFEKPNDLKNLELMNECAKLILEEFPDIIFAYGFSNEFSFVFKKETKFYQRRASKILSLVVSLFTSIYIKNWKIFFPQKDLKLSPSFHSRVICIASMEVLQSYLMYRQNDCHTRNLHDTCFYKLIENGKSEQEAEDILKGTQKQERNELLYQQFGVNYKNLPVIFRQGSCILKTEVEEIIKYNINGTPIKRLRRKIITIHSQNIASRTFWNEHSLLIKELGEFSQDINKIKPDFIKSFNFENKLLPSTWIVIRVDGCHFHRFSDIHEFEKPNDAQALNLMNSCAMSVVQEFKDLVFAYGVSDEYSFVLKKDSNFYERLPSEIVSSIVSFFSSRYVMKWKEFFPNKELKKLPYFDGRAVIYPSSEILRDYLSWRQVDCHINNQYNTCFWMLVKSGMSKSEAQNYLKGTQTQEKNELLKQKFNIDYYELPIMFRQGSSIFWDKEGKMKKNEMEGVIEKCRKKIVVEHCNIIESSFWNAHPQILDEK